MNLNDQELVRIARNTKVKGRWLRAHVDSTLQENEHIARHEEYADIDWDNLGYNLTKTDYIYKARCTSNNTFEQGKISDYGNIELSPAAGVLNYGQGIFEGTKAFRGEDNRILLFRPDQNATHMQIGAERICMQFPSAQQFVDAVKQTATANKHWVFHFLKVN